MRKRLLTPALVLMFCCLVSQGLYAVENYGDPPSSSFEELDDGNPSPPETDEIQKFCDILDCLKNIDEEAYARIDKLKKKCKVWKSAAGSAGIAGNRHAVAGYARKGDFLVVATPLGCESDDYQDPNPNNASTQHRKTKLFWAITLLHEAVHVKQHASASILKRLLQNPPYPDFTQSTYCEMVDHINSIPNANTKARVNMIWIAQLAYLAKREYEAHLREKIALMKARSAATTPAAVANIQAMIKESCKEVKKHKDGYCKRLRELKEILERDKARTPQQRRVREWDVRYEEYQELARCKKRLYVLEASSFHLEANWNHKIACDKHGLACAHVDAIKALLNGPPPIPPGDRRNNIESDLADAENAKKAISDPTKPEGQRGIKEAANKAAEKIGSVLPSSQSNSDISDLTEAVIDACDTLDKAKKDKRRIDDYAALCEVETAAEENYQNVLGPKNDKQAERDGYDEGSPEWAAADRQLKNLCAAAENAKRTRDQSVKAKEEAEAAKAAEDEAQADEENATTDEEREEARCRQVDERITKAEAAKTAAETARDNAINGDAASGTKGIEDHRKDGESAKTDACTEEEKAKAAKDRAATR